MTKNSINFYTKGTLKFKIKITHYIKYVFQKMLKINYFRQSEKGNTEEGTKI